MLRSSQPCFKQAIPVNGVKLLTSEYYNIDIAIANPPLNLGSLRMELFDISIIVLLAPPLMKATSRHWVNEIQNPLVGGK